MLSSIQRVVPASLSHELVDVHLLQLPLVVQYHSLRHVAVVAVPHLRLLVLPLALHLLLHIGDHALHMNDLFVLYLLFAFFVEADLLHLRLPWRKVRLGDFDLLARLLALILLLHDRIRYAN